MQRVTVIGCGIVGATIAYELSLIPNLQITVLDRQPPAQAATGAALGILMGVISHKVKGRNWRLREASIRRYATLIPELEAKTGQIIPLNRDGILSLCFETESLPRWQSLIEKRRTQNWTLELWSPDQVAERCPYLDLNAVVGAVYSPQDGQVQPIALTQALITAAQNNGVTFNFQAEVQGLIRPHSETVEAVKTDQAAIETDWVVIAAGLGTTGLTQQLNQPIIVGPVLGQALRLRLDHPLETPFQPVINGDDIHLVPLGQGEYWIGATVEFPSESAAQDAIALQPIAEQLEAVRQRAIHFCPAIAQATVLKTWSGLRPRPQNQPAPILEWLPHYPNVLLATGHYRNGVLLAPATAQWVRDTLLQRQS